MTGFAGGPDNDTLTGGGGADTLMAGMALILLTIRRQQLRFRFILMVQREQAVMRQATR